MEQRWSTVIYKITYRIYQSRFKAHYSKNETKGKMKEQNIPFKIWLLIGNVHSHLKALIMSISCWLTQHICSVATLGQRNIWISSHVIENNINLLLWTAITQTDMNEQSQLKTFWKIFAILSAIQHICKY